MTHVHRHIGAACFAGEVGYSKDGPILSWPAKAIATLTNDMRYRSNVVILFQPGNGRPGPVLLLLGRLPLQEPTHCGKVRPHKRVSAGCLVLSMAVFLLHLQ
ncbi:unnamed protein product [Arctogadus glacialis]